MFKKTPTVPLAFYEEQLANWNEERSALLNRIQHPSVFQVPQSKPSSEPVVSVQPDDPEPGTIVYGPDDTPEE